MKRQGTGKSLFAQALRGLLDDTQLFSRKDWADLLGVKQAAISQWVHDITIPRPDHLYVIFDTLKSSDLQDEERLTIFREISNRPSISVSPRGKRMLPTIWEYMTRPAFSELADRLAKLPPAEQEKYLEERYLKEHQPQSLPFEGQKEQQAKVFQVQKSSATPTRSSQHSRCFLDDFCGVNDVPVSKETYFIPPTLRVQKTNREISVDDLWEFPRVLIFGAPGSGKSMLLRQMASNPWQLLKNRMTQEPVIVYIHGQCLSKQLAAGGPIDVIRSRISPHVEGDRIVLLMDGLDEIPAVDRRSVFQALSEYVTRNSRMRLVLTSRPTTPEWSIDNLTRCEIEPLSVPHMIHWVHAQFSQHPPFRESKGVAAISRYISHLYERPDVLKTLRNPLFLSLSTTLFARNAVTAFYDADIFNECMWVLLDEWDRRKNIVRFSAPWARPQKLLECLSSISFHALREQLLEFTPQQAASWLDSNNVEAPPESILDVLSECTGVIRRSANGNWTLTHYAFQEYLAARYAIESSDEAKIILGNGLGDPRLQRVLRWACSITNDATPLLNFVLHSPHVGPMARALLLANMLAQQFSASTNTIRQACAAITELLENSFSTFSIETGAGDELEFMVEPRWRLAARNAGTGHLLSGDEGEKLRRILRVIHRARSSPARNILSDQLMESDSPVVKKFAECIEVEGTYRDNIIRQGEHDLLVAQVTEVNG